MSVKQEFSMVFGVCWPEPGAAIVDCWSPIQINANRRAIACAIEH